MYQGRSKSYSTWKTPVPTCSPAPADGGVTGLTFPGVIAAIVFLYGGPGAQR